MPRKNSAKHSSKLPKLKLYQRVVKPDNLFQAVIATAVVLALLLVLGVTFIEEFRDGRIILGWLAFSVAFLGWLFSAAVQLKNGVNQHTFDLILRTRFEHKFLEAMKTFRASFPIGGPVPKAKAKKIFESNAEKDLKIQSAIGFLLNYYEILAIAIYHRGADEAILKQYFYDLILRYYTQVKYFIPLIRKNSPNAFVYLEDLCQRWEKEDYA